MSVERERGGAFYKKYKRLVTNIHRIPIRQGVQCISVSEKFETEYVWYGTGTVRYTYHLIVHKHLRET